MFNSVTLAADGIRAFGVQDVSDREAELCIIIYGTTPDDSLNVTVEILGMMSPNLSDTSKSVQLLNSTSLTGAGAVAFADTLFGTSHVPYLYIRTTNADADSALTATGWLYMKQREATTIIQR